MTSRHQGSGLGTSIGPSEEELKESLAKLISYVAELRLFLKECPVWLKKAKVLAGILFIVNRGQNKGGGGAWVNCPQNFVRAHKIVRPRAQMALENVGSFQYLIYKTNLALKNKMRAIILNTRIQMALEIFGLFRPLIVKFRGDVTIVVI